MIHVRPFGLDRVESTVRKHDNDIAIVLPKHNQNSDHVKRDNENSGTFTVKDEGTKCRSANRSLIHYSSRIT